MTVDLTGVEWFKSSHSNPDGDCVEVAFLVDGAVGVRDSKNPNGSALIFTPNEWHAFTTGVVDGKFNRPRL